MAQVHGPVAEHVVGERNRYFERMLMLVVFGILAVGLAIGAALAYSLMTGRPAVVFVNDSSRRRPTESAAHLHVRLKRAVGRNVHYADHYWPVPRRSRGLREALRPVAPGSARGSHGRGRAAIGLPHPGGRSR